MDEDVIGWAELAVLLRCRVALLWPNLGEAGAGNGSILQRMLMLAYGWRGVILGV